MQNGRSVSKFSVPTSNKIIKYKIGNMSRRKQAKPRAVFKVGDPDDGTEQGTTLIDPKEEILTDNDTDDEEDQTIEHDELDNEVNQNDEHLKINPPKTPLTDKPQSDAGEPPDPDVKNPLTDDNDTAQPDPMPEDEEGLFFDDDDENENTSDSFYSDLYSTHTSSGYSPSMSEGTATPNSLTHQTAHPLRHHHHHQHHPHHHMHPHPNEGDANSHHPHPHNDEDNSSLHEGENGLDEENGESDERIRRENRMGSGSAAGVVVENARKAAMKMIKIERELAKSDKTTGDGIKSAADGSYQCQFCDKSFPRLGYLKKHEQSHAEHLPFKCEYCARLFKHKRSRDRHTKLHTGDRRYRCPHCEAAFSRSDHLKIHMKTHDNQKPFQCTICNRGYNTAAALTSHMQNHKKQAAILAAGGSLQALNYSPRSTGSASSNGSYNKRRYATVENSPSRMDFVKRPRSSTIACNYCTKADFASVDHLNSHMQAMHENVLKKDQASHMAAMGSAFQLSCEYCTMKFPSIPKMFQHMRSTHVDRLSSPNSYFEHFNRLAASGTFSPRLATPKAANNVVDETKIKQEEISPRSEKAEDEPTDLSQPKRRSQTPETPEKPGVFMCNQCNAGLPDFETFRNHLKTHINQGTSLVCHHCGLTLREQSEYERHVVAHFLITNSEYICASNCSKTFVKPDELHKHLFDSHVQTMYKCSICSELFDSKTAVQMHLTCAHTNESKIYRCSACMDSFRSDAEFAVHVKTRHQSIGGGSTSIQCMFCRTVCASELEMHFHLAAHARQFRCPSCPETFHVEFLLDRHMQTHHSQKHSNGPTSPIMQNGQSPMFMSSAYAKQAAQQNNNNNILDYHAFAAAGKGLFPMAPNGAKFYNPLQVDTNALKNQGLMYGLGQRYFDTGKTLLDVYNNYQREKDYFVSPGATFEGGSRAEKPATRSEATKPQPNGFSCGICERSDFRTESEVHSHRKIVHNLKTGVSLRCAYCSGNFKSRSELEHHMKTCHNSTGRHKCLICDEIFPSPAILAEHKLQHSKVGQSGKCSHCNANLENIAAFKAHLTEHNAEGQIPVQCICCRQTLNSDFEVGLHAKFHTKSSSTPETVCALCLESLPPTAVTKVCDKCCRKHNLSAKFNNMRFDSSKAYVENRCNLCKMILPHGHRLQEHLIEHTFVGCEERGYACYICSAVFTVPAGLLSHMNDHGPNARPYDCNLCTEKYFFRAELDHHLIDHENHTVPDGKESAADESGPTGVTPSSQLATTPDAIKSEVEQKHNVDEDEEFIEVEKVPEPVAAVEKSQLEEDD